MNINANTLTACDSPKVIREVIKLISKSLALGREWEYRQALIEELSNRGWKTAGTGCSSVVLRLGKYAIKISSDDFNLIRPFRQHPLFKKYAPQVYWIHFSGKAMLCQYVDLVRGDRNIGCEEWSSERRKIELEFSAHNCSGYDLHAGNIMRRKDDGRTMIVDYECFWQ